ncbi:MAG: 3-dehydroquinate dehydratase [Myxococcales bacterium]|nr:3-dehydroquinate dehydratase [Myxococcales bacterium]MBL0196719.1 3-dehydroquinate dehydratase [Myxococcales bacterium]
MGAAGPARESNEASRRLRIACFSGPNLQLLGQREPDVYGTETLAAIHARLHATAACLDIDLDARQTNHEGTLCDWIAELPGTADGLLLNAGAYTHTSIALLDALRGTGVVCVEVHLSNPEAREPFRRVSRVAAACIGKVCGFGGDSYLLALDGLVRVLRASAPAPRP